MKSSAKVVFGITSLLLALHALASSPVPIPEKYLELLRQAEAAVPNFPADASTENPGDETRAAVTSASPQLQKLGTVRAFAGDTEGAIAAFDMVELGRGGKSNMTKLDMLHVDQTIFYAHSRSAAESPLYSNTRRPNASRNPAQPPSSVRTPSDPGIPHPGRPQRCADG